MLQPNPPAGARSWALPQHSLYALSLSFKQATRQQCGRALKHYTARLGLACSPGMCHLHGDKAGDSRADLHLCTRCFLGWQKAVCSLTVFLQPFLSSTALWLSKVLVSSITPVKNFVSEKFRCGYLNRPEQWWQAYLALLVYTKQCKLFLLIKGKNNREKTSKSLSVQVKFCCSLSLEKFIHNFVNQ